jgi:hypothetical protein
LLTDPNNCGACGNFCSPGEICIAGTCCQTSQVCSDQCCPAGTCSEGNCCPEGWFTCGRGGPGSVCCPSGQCCDDGRCSCNGACCDAGEECCNGVACTSADSCCPAPAAGACSPGSGQLTSNNNYVFVDSAGGVINNLSISLEVTEDLAVSPWGGEFAIQLNTFPPPGMGITWVQYVLAVSTETVGAYGVSEELLDVTGDVEGWVECGGNFAYGTDSCGFWPFVPAGAYVGTIPGTTISKGTVLGIMLTTENGATTSVTFSQDGTSQTISLPAGQNPDQQMPVAGFQVNIVGVCNREAASIESGSGNITYSASDTLCATDTLSGGCCTAETSTVTYGVVSPCCSSSVVQSFTAT